MSPEELSILDVEELKKFRRYASIVSAERQAGGSLAASIQKAYVEVYGDIRETKHVTGEEDVRDTEHPCVDFKYGTPNHFNQCEGDGHYLCHGCAFFQPPSEDGAEPGEE